MPIGIASITKGKAVINLGVTAILKRKAAILYSIAAMPVEIKDIFKNL
jgi:hypothetical protein